MRNVSGSENLICLDQHCLRKSSNVSMPTTTKIFPDNIVEAFFFILLASVSFPLATKARTGIEWLCVDALRPTGRIASAVNKTTNVCTMGENMMENRKSFSFQLSLHITCFHSATHTHLQTICPPKTRHQLLLSSP